MFWTYTLQSLQGQLLDFHVLIAFLKVSILSIFVKLSGRISQIFILKMKHFLYHDILDLLIAF